MKKIMYFFTVVFSLLLFNYGMAGSDKTCDGKGGYRDVGGEIVYVCPLEGGDSDCVYTMPTGGCPATGGGGGGTN